MVTQFQMNEGAVEIGIGKIGIQPQAGIQIHQGLGLPAELMFGSCPVKPGFGIARVGLYDLVVMGNGILKPAGGVGAVGLAHPQFPVLRP